LGILASHGSGAPIAVVLARVPDGIDVDPIFIGYTPYRGGAGRRV
jgi:hypothetical protein